MVPQIKIICVLLLGPNIPRNLVLNDKARRACVDEAYPAFLDPGNPLQLVVI
jgi:hypothetical protein